MSRTADTHRSTARVALALALAAAAVSACSQAQAASVRTVGSPGRVAFPPVYGFTQAAPSIPSCVFCTDDVMRYVGSQLGGFAAYIPAWGIWRARYSGAQSVTVQYRVFHKNSCSDYALANGLCDDGFKLYKQYTGHYAVAANASGTTVPQWAEYVPANLPNAVSFGMDVIVTWRSPSGVLLGKTTIDYNAAGDYACLTHLCTIGGDAKHGSWLTLNV